MFFIPGQLNRFTELTKQATLYTQEENEKRENSLSELLRTAISNNNREAYLVFLDLLQEDEPAVFARLEKAWQSSAIFDADGPLNQTLTEFSRLGIEFIKINDSKIILNISNPWNIENLSVRAENIIRVQYNNMRFASSEIQVNDKEVLFDDPIIINGKKIQIIYFIPTLGYIFVSPNKSWANERVYGQMFADCFYLIQNTEEKCKNDILELGELLKFPSAINIEESNKETEEISLAQYANKFLNKTAIETDGPNDKTLEPLLKQALADNDRGAFQVFLDLLIERDPASFESLLNCKSLIDKLSALSYKCPGVIFSINTEKAKFLTDNFINCSSYEETLGVISIAYHDKLVFEKEAQFISLKKDKLFKFKDEIIITTTKWKRTGDIVMFGDNLIPGTILEKDAPEYKEISTLIDNMINKCEEDINSLNNLLHIEQRYFEQDTDFKPIETSEIVEPERMKELEQRFVPFNPFTEATEKFLSLTKQANDEPNENLFNKDVELNNLFSQALSTGDREAFLVFLDLLMEKKPRTYETLLDSSDFIISLILLFPICQNELSFVTGGVAFNKKNIFGINKIRKGDNHIFCEFENFTLVDGLNNDYYGIEFNQPPNLLWDDLEINVMAYGIIDGNYNFYIQGDLIFGSAVLNEDKPQDKKIIDFAQNIKKDCDNKINQLKELLSIPEKVALEKDVDPEIIEEASEISINNLNIETNKFYNLVADSNSIYTKEENIKRENILGDLLGKAISNNDKETYLVFLDLLQETYPETFARLEKLWQADSGEIVDANSPLMQTLSAYSRIGLSNVVASHGTSITFNIPNKWNIYNVGLYDRRKLTFECESFLYDSMRQPLSLEQVIKFKDPIVINDTSIKEIFGPNNNREIRTYEDNPLYSNAIFHTEGEDIYKQLLQIINDTKETIMSNLEELDNLLAFPQVVRGKDVDPEIKENNVIANTSFLLKQSADVLLNNLLTSAITNNDRDSFLVFLDLLEEQHRHLYDALATASFALGTEFNAYLTLLSQICKSAILHVDSKFYFPGLFNKKVRMIHVESYKNWEVEYTTYKFSFIKDQERKITFNPAKTFTFKNRADQITAIIMRDGTVTMHMLDEGLINVAEERFADPPDSTQPDSIPDSAEPYSGDYYEEYPDSSYADDTFDYNINIEGNFIYNSSLANYLIRQLDSHEDRARIDTTKLQKLLSFPKKKKEDSNSANDYTAQARKALNLTGNRYDKDLSGKAVLPDGRNVRLLTTEQAKLFGNQLHRIQIECRYCFNWSDIGHINQHEPSCKKKMGLDDPDKIRIKEIELKELKERLNKAQEELASTVENEDAQFEKHLIIADLYGMLSRATGSNKYKEAQYKHMDHAYMNLARKYVNERFAEFNQNQRDRGYKGEYHITGKQTILDGKKFPFEYDVSTKGYNDEYRLYIHQNGKADWKRIEMDEELDADLDDSDKSLINAASLKVKINKFYNLTKKSNALYTEEENIQRAGDLNMLLSSALSNKDREAYLVFLDLLQEDKPDIFSKLEKKWKNNKYSWKSDGPLANTLKAFIDIGPITAGNSMVAFLTDNYWNIEHIGFGSMLFVEYKDTHFIKDFGDHISLALKTRMKINDKEYLKFKFFKESGSIRAFPPYSDDYDYLDGKARVEVTKMINDYKETMIKNLEELADFFAFPVPTNKIKTEKTLENISAKFLQLTQKLNKSAHGLHTKEENTNKQKQLSDLLKTAFTGDREAFVVFLDLLEEEDPVLREKLNNKHFVGLFKELAPKFPNIIRMKTTLFGTNIIIANHIGNWDYIYTCRSEWSIRYKEYTSGIDRITFHPGHFFKLDNTPISQIMKIGDVFQAYEVPSRRVTFDSASPEFSTIQNIYDTLMNQTETDTQALTALFDVTTSKRPTNNEPNAVDNEENSEIIEDGEK